MSVNRNLNVDPLGKGALPWRPGDTNLDLHLGIIRSHFSSKILNFRYNDSFEFLTSNCILKFVPLNLRPFGKIIMNSNFSRWFWYRLSLLKPSRKKLSEPTPPRSFSYNPPGLPPIISSISPAEEAVFVSTQGADSRKRPTDQFLTLGKVERCCPSSRCRIVYSF